MLVRLVTIRDGVRTWRVRGRTVTASRGEPTIEADTRAMSMTSAGHVHGLPPCPDCGASAWIDRAAKVATGAIRCAGCGSDWFLEGAQ